MRERLQKSLVAEGTEDVKVGTVIAMLAEEGEDAQATSAAPSEKKTQSAAAEAVSGPG